MVFYFGTHFTYFCHNLVGNPVIKTKRNIQKACIIYFTMVVEIQRYHIAHLFTNSDNIYNMLFNCSWRFYE